MQKGVSSIGELLKLIQDKKFAAARALLQDMNEVDVAEFMKDIDDPKTLLLTFRLLPKELAADVFSYLDHDQQERIVREITDRELAGILDELYLDDTVDFLDELPASLVKRVLAAADADTRKQINALLMYPDDSAGSLMTTEFTELRKEWNVGQAISAIRRQCANRESIDALFVTDARRRLEGVIDISEVLSHPDETLIGDIMDTDIIFAATHEDQADVADKFKKYDLVSMPVVDAENRLVGIITIDDVIDVMEEETTEDIYKMAAMAPIEQSYMETGVFTLAKKRIGWLLLLMISATFTGMIIQNFETALAANVVLSTFIPMLMDTGGNAGSQASVSVIRGIVLGELHFRDLFKVMWKEFRISLLVGVTLAVVNFARVMLMNHSFTIALIVSLTLICTIIAAKLVGCMLPLVATKLHLDPALMASPMLTTIVDAVSLTIFFNIAVAFLPGI